MKTKFSRTWKNSKQPRKQRKYIYNAPLHTKQKFVTAHLTKELRKKYNLRSMPLRKGDKIKIIRGQFKNKTGTINKINLKQIKTYVEGIESIKKDGTKTFYPIHPSNIIITEPNMEDRKRKKIIEKKKITK